MKSLRDIASQNKFSYKVLSGILKYLYYTGARGVREIAQDLSYSYSHTYKAIYLLNSQGLVEIEKVPRDGKGCPYKLLVSLTSLGERFVKREADKIDG